MNVSPLAGKPADSSMLCLHRRLRKIDGPLFVGIDNTLAATP
jgi:hypothetical protein